MPERVARLEVAADAPPAVVDRLHQALQAAVGIDIAWSEPPATDGPAVLEVLHLEADASGLTHRLLDVEGALSPPADAEEPATLTLVLATGVQVDVPVEAVRSATGPSETGPNGP